MSRDRWEGQTTHPPIPSSSSFFVVGQVAIMWGFTPFLSNKHRSRRKIVQRFTHQFHFRAVKSLRVQGAPVRTQRSWTEKTVISVYRDLSYHQQFRGIIISWSLTCRVIDRCMFAPSPLFLPQSGVLLLQPWNLTYPNAQCMAFTYKTG